MSRRKSPQVAKRPRSSASSAASKAEPAGNPNGAPTPLPVKRRFLRKEVWGLLLLACALLFNAWYVAPELRIGRVPLNDAVYHLAASERLLTGIERGEPLLDQWVSEWALGYPVWQSYQPVPHLFTALCLWIFQGLASSAAIFAALTYLLIVLFPVSVYLGSRLLGLPPPAAGLAALLVFASSATGDLGSYGLGYGSVVWRGSGLYTQLFALHLLVISFGLTARALDRVDWKLRAGAGLALALTTVSHIIFGYAAFVSAGVLAVLGPGRERSQRLVKLVTTFLLGLLLVVWFVIPLILVKGTVNHSRWEEAQKWDSYGAPFILRELLHGRLLDFGRFPALSLLLAAGVAGAVIAVVRNRDPLAQRLLGLCGVWLALFFGRETWGILVALAGVPADLHMHRLQAVFELSAVLLTAYGVTLLITWIGRHARAAAVIVSLAVAAGVLMIAVDRAHYLNQNQTWGEENLAAYDREAPDLNAALDDVRAILAERPGRVTAGMAATWGKNFKVGSVPVYAFLTRDHMDQVSFLYHSMSKTSDVMVTRDENSAAENVALGIRATVAPADRPMPPYMRRRSTHGRFAVYESSPEGYFGLVDIGGYYTGPQSTTYEPNSAWLKDRLLTWGIVLALDPKTPIGPAVARWEALPLPAPQYMTRRGAILSESKIGETYRARVQMDRPAYAFVKITWHPYLVATVDGHPAALIPVTPGFGAVAVPAGVHEVEVAYRPGPLKMILVFLGAGLFAGLCIVLHRGRLARAEANATQSLAQIGQRFATPRAAVAAALIFGALVALHPLFRGKLISGHDAAAYPPRLIEFVEVMKDFQLPPVWAPDLGAGHGQPLFEFAPPLLYLSALPFHSIGMGITDSYQFGLALLHLLGLIAFYRLARKFAFSRMVSAAGSIAWLFTPYLALDLFVRAAFAEAAAVAILPIVLLGLVEVMERPGAARVVLGAIPVALLMLAHNAMALLVIPALTLMVVLRGAVTWQQEKGDKFAQRIAPLIAGAASIALGLALSAYFWLPALIEKSYVHMERLRTGYLNWENHLVWPIQLLWSPWGYGLSGAGLKSGMSFALGPVHLALAILGLVFALRSRDPRFRAYAIAFGLAAILGAWLSTLWAGAVWQHVATLQFLQFPWRALVLPGLMMPVLALFAFERIGPKWTVAAVLLLVVFNLPHTEPVGYLTFDDEYYAPESIATRGLNTLTAEEYEPKTVAVRPPYNAQALSGPGSPLQVETIARSSIRQEYVVRASVSTAAEASTFMYPGWTATIDGAPSVIKTRPISGTMLIDIPPGEHRLVLQLRQTHLRRAAMWVSILAMIAALALVLPGRRRPWLSSQTESGLSSKPLGD
jgi:hypothetical protein